MSFPVQEKTLLLALARELGGTVEPAPSFTPVNPLWIFKCQDWCLSFVFAGDSKLEVQALYPKYDNGEWEAGPTYRSLLSLDKSVGQLAEHIRSHILVRFLPEFEKAKERLAEELDDRATRERQLSELSNRHHLSVRTTVSTHHRSHLRLNAHGYKFADAEVNLSSEQLFDFACKGLTAEAVDQVLRVIGLLKRKPVPVLH